MRCLQFLHNEIGALRQEDGTGKACEIFSRGQMGGMEKKGEEGVFINLTIL